MFETKLWADGEKNKTPYLDERKIQHYDRQWNKKFHFKVARAIRTILYELL